jgi:hypothetical protein
MQTSESSLSNTGPSFTGFKFEWLAHGQHIVLFKWQLLHLVILWVSFNTLLYEIVQTKIRALRLNKFTHIQIS